ncbi:MAG: hypothetical protein HN686_10500 [Bacteroidetes bacterium]|jgi:hypothetical protein|nr:hypothetical protein [Bacteroidota bacterium]MBT7464404.1 hypothetical protein [Bacteroidota bacterium]
MTDREWLLFKRFGELKTKDYLIFTQTSADSHDQQDFSPICFVTGNISTNETL